MGHIFFLDYEKILPKPMSMAVGSIALLLRLLLLSPRSKSLRYWASCSSAKGRPRCHFKQFNRHHAVGNRTSSSSFPLRHSVPIHTQPPYEIENPMDYTTVPELQPNPTPASLPSYPPAVAAYLPASYPPHYQLFYQNPNPSSADPQSSIGTQEFQGGTVAEPGLNPPGVASYAPVTSDSVSHLTHEAHANYSYAHNPGADSSSGYYYDPNVQNWAAREAVMQYGVDPAGYGAAIPLASTGSEQLATATTNSAWWTNTTTQPHGNGARKKPKKPKKPKIKVVQSAYCEVCKIDCTSKDVLDQHKLGKKHKKNLEKLKEALKPPPAVPVPPSTSSNCMIGPQPEGDKSKSSKKKRKATQTPADLENKKKKVLEGGAAAEAVKICTICNVVCNSETVFNYHLAGQKHAAMLKKQASNT